MFNIIFLNETINADKLLAIHNVTGCAIDRVTMWDIIYCVYVYNNVLTTYLYIHINNNKPHIYTTCIHSKQVYIYTTNVILFI